MALEGLAYFVDEMSDRVNRGLRVSEEAVREGEEHEPGGEVDEKTEVDEVITDLRGSTATPSGMGCSTAAGTSAPWCWRGS